MGTSMLTTLAELKMHIRSEHQERSTKVQMKHHFAHQSEGPTSYSQPSSQPSPPDIDFKPATTVPAVPPCPEKPNLCHIVPNKVTDEGQQFTGREGSISLKDLFGSGGDCWIMLYDEYTRKHLDEELVLCVLNQDSMTDEAAEIDVNELTGEILVV
jgi:hypothetical protein